MKYLLFIVFSSFLLLGFDSSENEKLNLVINGLIKNYKSHSSISYNIVYKRKPVFRNDTSVIHATCNLLRVPTDSIFNGYIWINADKKYEIIYDLKQILRIDHSKKDMIIDIPKIGQRLSGNALSNLFEIYFLKPEKINRYFEDTNNKISMSVERDNNTEYFHIIIAIPGDENASGGERHIYIDKKTLTITKIILIVKMQSDNQYEEWNLRDVEFDKINSGDIKNHVLDLQKKYNKITESENNNNIEKLLDISSTAPNFEGVSFHNKKKFYFNTFSDSLVLLDFWYMACPPCLKLIPKLLDVYKEFKDQGLNLLGVNSFDKDNIKILSQFIKDNKISYPIVLTEKSTDNLYLVKGYPTCYVINKGKVIYSESGFSASLVDTLRKIIKNEIDKK